MFSSYLYFVTSVGFTIGVYDLRTYSLVREFTFEGSIGQSIHADEVPGVIYWVANDTRTGMSRVMRTDLDFGDALFLNIQYEEEIAIALDQIYMYVFVKDQNRTDLYYKTSPVKVGEFQLNTEVTEMIVALGKCMVYWPNSSIDLDFTRNTHMQLALILTKQTIVYIISSCSFSLYIRS